MSEKNEAKAYPKIPAPRLVMMLDGPDSHAAYGSDVLPGETVGEYRQRKEREREALSARSSQDTDPED